MAVRYGKTKPESIFQACEWINNNEGRGYLTCDVAKYILGRKKLSKSEIIAKYTKKLNDLWSTCNIKIKGEK